MVKEINWCKKQGHNFIEANFGIVGIDEGNGKHSFSDGVKKADRIPVVFCSKCGLIRALFVSLGK